jgi:ATP synthase subunit 6
MYFSPLEQFEIIPLFSIFNIYFTNSFLIFLIGFIFFFTIFNIINFENIIPSRIQQIIELIFFTVLELIFLNIGSKGRYFFPLIFNLFLFLLLCNLIGIIPYSFTLTSHLSITLALALMTYFGYNFIGIKKHKIKFLTLFLPGGANFILIPLLVPIEIVSYVFRVISLPVRLFANMMAGHTLLKVIAGFAWIMINLNLTLFIAHFIPMFLLVLLIGLELGVALIQAYVFTILTCIYINDALNLH